LKTRPERKRRKRPFLPETGAWGFLVTAVALIVSAAFLHDFYGMRLGWVGSYIWFLAIAFSFGLTVVYHALFLTPKRGETGWRQAVDLLLIFYVRQAIRIISFGAKPQAKRSESDAPAIPASFEKVRAGIIPSHQAAAMVKDGIFTRADGPGYVKLNKGEKVRELMDLRKQLRALPVTAVTRDGIPLQAVIVVVFQLRAARPEDAPEERQYWHNEEAIFQALYEGSVNAEKTPRHWMDRPAPAAADRLIAILATKTLDDLLQPLDPTAAPIEEIKSEIRRLVSAEMAGHGIDVIAIALSQLTLPPDVAAERIRGWQATWERQIQAEEASGKAEAWRRVQLARARAQMEMIDSITSSIETIYRRGDGDISEVVTLRMIEALETAVSDDAVKALLPSHILNSLDQIQRWLVAPPQIVNQRRED
jgi:hypothetical protein